MAQNPTQRGYLDAFVDRLGAWHSGLASERSSYTTQEVRIPLENEDGIHLAATVYQPVHKDRASPAAGTILVQSPYGRGAPLSLFAARLWAARNYNVLMVSVRGSFGSDGELDPARNDRADGPFVVRWMRKQTWYTGSFATWGMSYLGYTQWALMASDEPLDDMAAAIVSVGPHDFADLLWGTGAHWFASVDWAHGMARQESLSWWQSIYVTVTADPNEKNGIKRTMPLDEAVKASLGGADAPHYKWLHNWLANEDIEKDPAGYWECMKQDKGLNRKGIPVLLLGGWQDVFTNATFHQYQQLKDNGCIVGLTVGPWNHMEVGASDGVTQEVLDWLDKYLAKQPGDNRQQPVRINVTGANEWRWLPSWPPATQPLQLFLESNSRLSRSCPLKTDEAQFEFDPHDPTPTMGGGLLMGGGYVNDAALAKRVDVLSFDLEVDQDFEVLGTPHVELLHSSDNVHVDVFVRLSEVNSKGISRNLCEVYKRLDPARAQPGQAVKVNLALSPVAHRFARGTKIRLLVAGANFPHYSFNRGTGEPLVTGTTLRPASHTVHIGEDGSKLVLPVSLS
ncbi:unnamed protein product [Discula destructiva]